jgi:hypothetical protein
VSPLTLDRNYVLEPFHALISTCQNNVLLGLRIVEKVEIFPIQTAEELQFIQLAFGGVPNNFDQSKVLFKRWILLNGLKDINQCIGTTLQRFIVFKTIAGEMRRNSALNVEARESELRHEMRHLPTPQLIERVNLLCSEPLILQKEIESFNRARNCLEHAVGTVVKKFCNNPEKDKLTIFGRRFKLFFKRGEEEVLAHLGKPGLENAALMLGAEDFEIQFAEGQSIELSLKQFLDVLNTCVFIRADVDLKLG